MPSGLPESIAVPIPGKAPAALPSPLLMIMGIGIGPLTDMNTRSKPLHEMSKQAAIEAVGRKASGGRIPGTDAWNDHPGHVRQEVRRRWEIRCCKGYPTKLAEREETAGAEVVAFPFIWFIRRRREKAANCSVFIIPPHAYPYLPPGDNLIASPWGEPGQGRRTGPPM